MHTLAVEIPNPREFRQVVPDSGREQQFAADQPGRSAKVIRNRFSYKARMTNLTLANLDVVLF